jgi:hypothetical protein
MEWKASERNQSRRITQKVEAYNEL